MPEKKPLSPQAPVSSRYTSKCLLARIDQLHTARHVRAYSSILTLRSLLVVDGERISHAQSGTTSMQCPSGRYGMRCRRQPAQSGTITSMSRAKWISGSSIIYQPPAPPNPYPKAKIEVDHKGLTLRHSPPPISARMIVM